MDEIEENGRKLKEALDKLEGPKKEAVIALIQRISEYSVKAGFLMEMIGELCPGILSPGFSGDVPDNVMELIKEYNAECDKVNTILGMIPDEAISGVFKKAEKIHL